MTGAYHTPVRRRQDEQSLEEMILEAARGALDDAGLTVDDVDGVILATADQVHGRVIESMVTNGPAGGVGRDTTTLASAGEHAFVYACLCLLAGHGRRLLVMTWGKESEGVDPAHAELVAAEPFLLRPLGMKATVAAGLQAASYASRHGLDEQAVREVRAARGRAAARAHGISEREDNGSVAADIVAWPLTVADLPKNADMAAAMVLVTGEDASPENAPAWVHGVGWSIDRYELAERDLSRFEALEAATRRAFPDGSSAAGADVVEVQEISTIAGFAACEALGLSGPGQGAQASVGDSSVVNPSGGNLPVNPSNAAGFLRMLAACQQVRGRAGAVQVDASASMTAVGAAVHGFAGQGAAVGVFGAREQPIDLSRARVA